MEIKKLNIYSNFNYSMCLSACKLKIQIQWRNSNYLIQKYQKKNFKNLNILPQPFCIKGFEQDEKKLK